MPTVSTRKELPRPSRSGKGVARGEAATGGHYSTGQGCPLASPDLSRNSKAALYLLIGYYTAACILRQKLKTPKTFPCLTILLKSYWNLGTQTEQSQPNQTHYPMITTIPVC